MSDALQRVSVSHLDNFDFYMNPPSWAGEGKSIEDFIADIRGKSEPTEPMLTGRAVHSILEYRLTGNAITRDGHFIEESEEYPDIYTVDMQEGTWAISLREVNLVIPRGASERRANRELSELGVDLRGRADMVTQWRILDFKSGTNAPDSDKYVRSWQWRAYLWLFGLRLFTYKYIRLGKVRGEEHAYVATQVSTFDCWRYPRMEEDLLGKIREWRDFAAEHGIYRDWNWEAEE